MAHAIRARTLALFALGGAISLPLAVTLSACGGGEKPPETPPAPSAGATPIASAPAATTESTAAPASSAAPSDTGSAAAATPPPTNPGSTKVTTKSDPAWASCHQSYKANAMEVSKDVAAMAKGCAAVTKMKLVGKTLTGKQADAQTPQTFPLKAKANHCYRVYAQAADGIKDLDVVVKDSAGATAGEDSTDDPSPVVLEDGAICFKADDDATIVVSVGMGNGAYAVQIWGD
jgi:hypothetical protein